MVVPAPHPTRAAFTLIELSVVIAIIGVLAGAIVTGQTLVRQSQISSIVSDYSKFGRAYGLFKQQYKAPPGDLLDAQDYWGTDPNGCGTNTVTTPRRETCNGDNDGMIGATAGGYYEVMRAWQQLSDAGFIEGTFSGVGSTLNQRQGVPGQNQPPGKLAQTGYWISTIGAFTADSSAVYFNMSRGTMILYGSAVYGGGGTYDSNATLTPREALQLDQKLDDGFAVTGAFMPIKVSTTSDGTCTTTTVSTTAVYNISNNGKACVVTYVIDWIAP